MAKDADAPKPNQAGKSDETWDDATDRPEGTGSGDDPILTHAEIEEIRKQARKEILDLRKKNARTQFLEAEKLRLQREEGLVTGNAAKDQMVRITVNLADYAAAITINGKPYWHGHTYTCARHVAETLREIMQRSHNHQAEIDGKGLKAQYQARRETVISAVKGVQNAPARPDGSKVAI